MPVAPALLELSPIVLLAIALGLAIISTIIIKALFGPLISFLQSIPGIGGALAYPFEKAAGALAGAMGAVEHGIDSAIGFMFHQLAAQWNWLWREIKSHAALIGIVSPLLAAAIYAIQHLRAHVHGIRGITKAVSHAVKRLEKEYHGIEHRVRTIEREIAHGIGHDLRIRVAGLEDTVGNIQSKVIPNLRSAVNTAETDLADLRKWVTDNIPLPGTKAFAGAVAVALTALGLDWIKCNSAKNVLNKRTCSLWNSLDDLLGLATAVLVLEEYETMVREAGAIQEEATKLILAAFKIDT